MLRGVLRIDLVCCSYAKASNSHEVLGLPQNSCGEDGLRPDADDVNICMVFSLWSLKSCQRGWILVFRIRLSSGKDINLVTLLGQDITARLIHHCLEMVDEITIPGMRLLCNKISVGDIILEVLVDPT